MSRGIPLRSLTMALIALSLAWVPSAVASVTLREVWQVAALQSYNTALVVLSTMALGIAAGTIGSFLLLRKRSLMGDALSHAALPGVGLAFLIMVAFGGTGKFLPGLLAGASIAGLVGVGLVLAIRNTTRLQDDTAMGIVLSVLFGFGVAVLRLAQDMPGGSPAGLESFIYGKTASMVFQDFVVIVAIAVLVTMLCGLLFKEFKLLCFDEGFGATQGWPVRRLDVLMLVLVTAVTVVGMQAVGLILIIAFLIAPAAAARFWTNDLRTMVILAAAIGGLSGWLGASLSALLPRLPAGAVIVLVAAGVFGLSMIFGSRRGVLRRALQRRALDRKIGRQHLLRAAYELIEIAQGGAPQTGELRNVPVSMSDLLGRRTWTRTSLARLVRVAVREDHVEDHGGDRLRLSESGFGEAARVTRNHRLWEQYLIQYADVAPAHVDRDADMVEHVLGAEIVQSLEEELSARGRIPVMPPSVHEISTERQP